MAYEREMLEELKAIRQFLGVLVDPHMRAEEAAKKAAHDARYRIYKALPEDLGLEVLQYEEGRKTHSGEGK